MRPPFNPGSFPLPDLIIWIPILAAIAGTQRAAIGRVRSLHTTEHPCRHKLGVRKKKKSNNFCSIIMSKKKPSKLALIQVRISYSPGLARLGVRE